MINISKTLGSWPAIVAVPVLCVSAQLAGLGQLVITYTLSVLALTFTQLVLRQQNAENDEDKKIQQEQLKIEKHIEKEVKDNA